MTSVVKAKPVKKNPVAYAVQNDDDYMGGIVFARSNAEARRKGSAQFGDGDFNWGAATRAPWADQYWAHGRVPKLAMVGAGWWIECTGCEIRIGQDEEDDDGNPLELDPVEDGDCLFCTPQCRNDHFLTQRETKAREAIAIRRLALRFLRSFPGAWLSGSPHAYVRKERDGRWQARQVIIRFRFPGCTIGDGHYRLDTSEQPEPQILICNGDKMAWDAWRANVAESRAHASLSREGE